MEGLTARLPLLALLFGLALQGCSTTGGLKSPPPIAPRDRAPLPVPAESYPPANAIDIPCMQTTHGCIALNPDVTQDSIDQTICVSGYTKSVRPGTAYTNGVKLKLLRERGEGPDHMADYELDHRIPLALGGHPRKLSNLMLQRWEGEGGAKTKDVLEVQLQRRVCRHEIELNAAQYCIAENWQTCASDLATGRQLVAADPVNAADASPDPSILSSITRIPEGSKVTICRIKGNISKRGKIYHLPGSASYEQVKIDESKGERWFCTESEARSAGWRTPTR
jgi:hypothetical protein